MESAEQLSKRFKDVILDGKWIAFTNWKDQLDQIGFTDATQQVSNLNTIALLTYHINYYIEGVLNVFRGGELEIRDKFSFNLPQLKSEDEWESLKAALYSNSEEFADHVSKMDGAKLSSNFVKEEYGDYRRNIQAMIEHAYYHLGQVVIIRKMIASE